MKVYSTSTDIFFSPLSCWFFFFEGEGEQIALFIAVTKLVVSGFFPFCLSEEMEEKFLNVV